MVRVKPLLLVCLALAASAWPPAASIGQVASKSEDAVGTFQPLLGEEALAPRLDGPGGGQAGQPISAAGHEPSVGGPVGVGTGPFGPDGGGVPTCPDCGAVYPEPLFGESCGCPATKSRLGGLFSPPSGRYRGPGHPLQRESWLYRPFSAGWFMGMMQGGMLMDDWLGMQRGFFGGYRLGWDHDYYWGGEMRFAFGSVELFDTAAAKQAQREADLAAGHDPDDPHDAWAHRFEQRRDADMFQWDVSVIHYPWGDSQWRPYLMAGLGAAQIGFTDRLSRRHHDVVFATVLAAGLKYRYNDWLALRLDCADNVLFGNGSGFQTVHNLSATAGVEVRFGGARKAYWPWNPGRHYW